MTTSPAEAIGLRLTHVVGPVDWKYPVDSLVLLRMQGGEGSRRRTLVRNHAGFGGSADAQPTDAHTDTTHQTQMHSATLRSRGHLDSKL